MTAHVRGNALYAVAMDDSLDTGHLRRLIAGELHAQPIEIAAFTRLADRLPDGAAQRLFRDVAAAISAARPALLAAAVALNMTEEGPGRPRTPEGAETFTDFISWLGLHARPGAAAAALRADLMQWCALCAELTHALRRGNIPVPAPVLRYVEAYHQAPPQLVTACADVIADAIADGEDPSAISRTARRVPPRSTRTGGPSPRPDSRPVFQAETRGRTGRPTPGAAEPQGPTTADTRRPHPVLPDHLTFVRTLMRIAIIGAGAAGLTTAWLLDETEDVTVYESAPRVGGHADSVSVDLDGRTVHVDLGAQHLAPDSFPAHTALRAILDITADDILEAPPHTTVISGSAPQQLLVTPDAPLDSTGAREPVTGETWAVLGRFVAHATAFEKGGDWSMSPGELTAELDLAQEWIDHLIHPWLASFVGCGTRQAAGRPPRPPNPSIANSSPERPNSPISWFAIVRLYSPGQSGQSFSVRTWRPTEIEPTGLTGHQLDELVACSEQQDTSDRRTGQEVRLPGVLTALCDVDARVRVDGVPGTHLPGHRAMHACPVEATRSSRRIGPVVVFGRRRCSALGLVLGNGDGDAQRRGDVACCRHDAGGAYDGRDGDQDVL